MRSALAPAAALARLAIRGIDWLLRKAYGVAPFSHEPECILRISPGSSRRAVVLSDGTQVKPGDPIVHLHLWNERLRDLPNVSDSLGWGRLLLHQGALSLQLLARYLEVQSAAAHYVALRGEPGFVTDLRSARAALERLGFEVFLKESPGFRLWRRAFWDNFYSFLLLWTFGPHTMKGKELGRLQRLEIWMSRARLTECYGGEVRTASSQGLKSGVS
ncbi:MAG: hypothetical protein AB1449_04200 [Chloroflexota bacterium]